jgi:uncharacterized protein (TIGR03437 family)
VPDAIAGSNSVRPTAGGDFGVPASAGQYAPNGKGSLLLVRVRNADANGGGGSLVLTPQAGINMFDSVSELDVVNGTAQAVYEVVDADSSVQESAQFPTFIGLDPSADSQAITITPKILLGPVDSGAQDLTVAPIPRFSLGTPASDCTVLKDCDGPFLPKLAVDFEPLSFNTNPGGSLQSRFIRVFNAAGNILVWNATLQRMPLSDFLRLTPASGVNNGSIGVNLLPTTLRPGVYYTTITIDAGQEGRIDLLIRAEVNAAQSLVDPTPAISSVVNAATFAAGPLVRGSFGTIKGANLLGTNMLVTFDNLPAKLVYTSNTQINFLVPAELGPRSTSQMVVTVDGVSSIQQSVRLADVAPGIFSPGILNQDNAVNTPFSPAPVDSVIQIFATGLLPPEGGTVDVKIHDRSNLVPLYAANVPAIPGLQQVNVRVPAGLPGINTEVVICGSSSGRRVCSPRRRSRCVSSQRGVHRYFQLFFTFKR